MKAVSFCLAAALACSTLLSSTISEAAEIKVSGNVNYEVVYHNQTELADGRVVSRDHLKGMVDDNDDKSPIDHSTHDCFGAIVFSGDGTTIQGGHGYCDGIDKDGDIWWLSWSTNSPTESAWTITGGTGKYAGASGTGKTSFETDKFSVAAESGPSTLPNTYEGVMTLR
jgi:hypothetical protein